VCFIIQTPSKQINKLIYIYCIMINFFEWAMKANIECVLHIWNICINKIINK
jgi:hypothetical protein